MTHIAEIIWKSIGVGIVALFLIAAVVAGVWMTPRQQPCVSLQYTIEDAEERMYISEGELDRLLQSKDLYPVGKALQRGMLNRIERTIADHPMVRHAECYYTPREQMYVSLTQRTPILRVQTAGEHYLIDADRRVMTYRAAVRDSVLVVKGTVSAAQAAGELAQFAIWVEDQPYWRNKIQYIYVQSPFKIYLYLPGQPRVLLGAMSGYERKLSKLRTFLEKSPEEVRQKHYQELDIRFDGQVIGKN